MHILRKQDTYLFGIYHGVTDYPDLSTTGLRIVVLWYRNCSDKIGKISRVRWAYTFNACKLCFTDLEKHADHIVAVAYDLWPMKGMKLTVFNLSSLTISPTYTVLITLASKAASSWLNRVNYLFQHTMLFLSSSTLESSVCVSDLNNFFLWILG